MSGLDSFSKWGRRGPGEDAPRSWAVILGVIVVGVIFVAIIPIIPFKKAGGAKPDIQPAFVPGDSYCADLPRLAKAYRDLREKAERGGATESVRSIDRDAFADMVILAEACANENEALGKEAERSRLESEAAAQRLLDVLSEGYPCCDEDNAVVFVGCPETVK